MAPPKLRLESSAAALKTGDAELAFEYAFVLDQLGLPPLDAGETDEEVARRLQRAEEEDYGGDLVSFE